MTVRNDSAQRARAEEIGLQALVFLTEEEDRLVRFLGDTGLSPDQLRQGAGQPEMLAAVLDYLLADESALLVFSTAAGIKPETVASARALLPGADEEAKQFAANHQTSGNTASRAAPKRASKRWAGPGS